MKNKLIEGHQTILMEVVGSILNKNTDELNENDYSKFTIVPNMTDLNIKLFYSESSTIYIGELITNIDKFNVNMEFIYADYFENMKNFDEIFELANKIQKLKNNENDNETGRL